jgi:pSer/pThr/pTyr-binding forkhead associated (FHA) protein
MSETISKRTKPWTLRSSDGRVLFAVPAARAVTVGRSDECDLRLTDPSVSGRHASVFVLPDGLTVVDERSTSGTYVNEQPVSGHSVAREGDVVRFGRVTLRLLRSANLSEGVESGGHSDTVTWDQPPSRSPDPVRTTAPAQPSTLPPRNDRVIRIDAPPGTGRGRVVVRGTVRSPALRSEPYGRNVTFQVLSFSLMVYDRGGGRSQAVGVEIRGLSIQGPAPVDGQEVQVTGRYSRSGVLEADHIQLVDSGATVRSAGMRTLKRGRALGAVFMVLVLAGMLAIGYSVLNDQGLNPLAPMVTVPAVNPGENLGVVDSRMRDAGFRTEWRDDTSSTVPFGTVIRISPPSGTQLRKGSLVEIYTNAQLGSG